MPFTPNNISAVVLYGKKTCDRLTDILNYWQTILTDHAWDRYLFLCVTKAGESWNFPGAGEATAGTQELINRQIIRCMHISIDEKDPVSWAMPRMFLEELQYRLKIGNVMVHCICDDLRVAPPVEAAVSLTESANRFLGAGNVTNLYYLMLRETREAREKQRSLALAVAEKQPNAPVYLLSRVANDASRMHKFELWRAVMCEILVASDGRRRYFAPFVYSLGYTSLNANDQELFSLRRHNVAELLRQHYETPMTNTEAWDILTARKIQAPTEYHAYAIQAAVQAWVESLANQFVINPSERELKNLCILADISKPDRVSGLQDIVKKFFEANQTARTLRLLRSRVEEHVENVMQELRNCINVKEFPAALLHHVQEALAAVEQTPVQYMPASLPQKRFLEPAEEYLTKCSRMVADSVRRVYLGRASSRVAGFLAVGLKKVESAVDRLQLRDHFNHTMQSYRLLSSDEETLKIKYPRYAQAVADTVHDGAMNLFGTGWVRSQGALYRSDFVADEDVLHRLVEKGEDVLHRHMPRGFSASFMDALHSEFPTDTQMTAFLNQYLHIERHMFHCPLATPGTEGDMYFVDDDLQYTPWAQSNADKSIVVDNDNIEQLSFVHLNKSLQWLASEWQRNNRYFGTQDEETTPNRGGNWVSSGQTGAPAMPAAAAAAETEAPDDNPRKIRLVNRDNRFILTWEWENHMISLLVKVGTNPVKPCAATEYLIKGGYDVTDLIGYGKNDILLQRHNGTVYGAVSLCGRKHTVQYRFLPSSKGGVQLKLNGRVPPTGTLLLGEMVNRDTVYFYPVASRGLNGPAAYDGLMLNGKYQLMVSPEDRFPMVNPVQDISL